MKLTESALRAAMPNAKPANIERWIGPLGDAMAANAIDSRQRMAGFLASVANETGELAAEKETTYFNTDYNYAKEKVFGQRMPPKALWDAWRKEGPDVFYIKFFNWVYDDRKFPFLGLGNVEEGDGSKFVARGPGITGRANYRTIGKRIGLDLEANPDLLLDPAIAAPAFAGYWRSIGNNERLDAGNFLGAMEVMNPGLGDFSHHLAHFEKANAALAEGGSEPPTTAVGVLREGSIGPDVVHLQERLAHGGWYRGTIDGIFGPATKQAVIDVQHNLFPGEPKEWDGVVGPKTAGGLRL